MRAREHEAIINRAKLAAGNQAALARKLKISAQAVSQWKKIPLDRIVEIEKATGIPRYELRPDKHETTAITMPTFVRHE